MCMYVSRIGHDDHQCDMFSIALLLFAACSFGEYLSGSNIYQI